MNRIRPARRGSFRVRRRRGSTYGGLAASLGSVWLRFNEITGTAVINYGTGGATFDGVWTPGSGAQGQTGALGPNEAYNFQTGSVVTIPISGVLASARAFTEIYVVKPVTAGPGGIGMFSFFGGATEFRFNGALTSLIAQVDIAGTDVQSVTTTGLQGSQNALLAKTFDYDGDKLIRLYKGQSQTLTEYAYSTQTPGGGGGFLTRSGNLYIGNNAANGRIQDGLIDEYLYVPSIVPFATLELMTKLINPT
jgi:hypothetical protein